MTITAEPRFDTQQHYAHSPFRTPHRPLTSRLRVTGASGERYEEILTDGALDFVCGLHRQFAGRRAELLAVRRCRRDQPRPYEFLPETASIRNDPSWRVAPTAPGLEDRRCEITGPPTAKMTINALNSGARVWMADFEDATSPTWSNVIEGQLNLYDAVRRQIDFTGPDGRRYELNRDTATIMVRPRGWHLTEKHLVMDGQAIPAAFVDFGLFFFHNALTLINDGRGPYFYLPKLQSHHEARLWHDVFAWAEEALGIPHGTIRATCLIETFPAAFEMAEILYELRDYSAGLNAGRWDYIFSFIKNHADDPSAVLPNRAEITMTVPFMRAYTELLVKTCHERGAHAIGGMAAFVPSAASPEATATALEKTRSDKAREAGDGFDGSWVAHPGLVPTCTEVFSGVLGERANQLDRRRDDVHVTARELSDLGDLPRTVTLSGVRTDLRVPLVYLSSWVAGQGAVAIDHLMEDAATVEISRMQLWQWIRHRATTSGGVQITRELVSAMLAEEVERMLERTPESERWTITAAQDILEHGCLDEEFPSFVTSYGYSHYLAARG
ncbi:malate synthase A [Microlunatus ginsengisoli]|uniref:malate synthase n=1 Tax=Microlunatus ginsengisoli TaxID=363863 RepID=A0ABP7AV82_9ACTN